MNGLDRPAAVAGQSFEPGSPRWIAFHAPGLGPALEPLASHRRKQGYAVTLVPVVGGNESRVRETAESLKLSPRAGDCMLLVGAFGEAGGTGLASVFPPATGRHGRMRGVPSDNVLGLDTATGVPRLPVGRLPAGSSAELAIMVRKILAFEASKESRAADGRFACLVGNPMPGEETSAMADGFMNHHSKGMLKKIDARWQLSGAADVKGHPFDRSDDFPRGVAEVSASNYEALAYFGHSDARGIASRGHFYLLPGDWRRMPPGDRGIFFTCGCYAAENQTAYAVEGVKVPGGPVAAIAARGESYSAPGYLAGLGLADCMSGNEGPATVGEWWMKVQEGISYARISRTSFFLMDQVDGSDGKTSLKDQRLEHLEMWTLIGDPATRTPRQR